MNGKILWDCHMHSSFSEDSETPMEEMLQKANSLGLAGVCFTEHLDPDLPASSGTPGFFLDIPAYQDRLVSLKEAFHSQLKVRFGIEIGLQPHLASYYDNLLKEYPFDFVIGSSHVAGGRDPYYPSFFEGRTEAEAHREYFESILQNLQAFHEMDVYGHLDYVVRYGPTQNKNYRFEDFSDILDEILRTLLACNVGLELNTGGFHYGLGQPNPSTDILKRYRELGGEIITIGADAHTPDKIGWAFDRAASVLSQCGYRYYTVFRSRRPEFLKL